MDSISIFTGTTCYINGERGTTTGFVTSLNRTVGAFISLSERSAMLYATVQVSLDAQHHYDVIASREITRDDFDVLSGIASVRKQCGWVEPTKVAA